MSTIDAAAGTAQPREPSSGLYRAVWRWHFYAGLMVMPFLVLLAVTGGLYLFKPEIEQLVYRDMVDVTARAEGAPLGAVEAVAERSLDGQMLQMILLARADRSIQMLVRVPSGEVRTAYVDPYAARFLGSAPYGGVMQTVRKLHSLQLFGAWASALIEIAAGWAIVMVLTGLFLWWPRGAEGGVISVRATPKQRLFWRDLHAVVGAFAAILILFLAVTGMPWSMVWGKQVQGWVAAQGLGRPSPPEAVTPAFLLGAPRASGLQTQSSEHHHDHGAVTEQLPWALQQTAPPQSGAPGGASLPLDVAVARFEALGLQRPFAVQPPEGERGAWAATYAPDRADQVRMIYLDRRSGAVIGDVGYRDFGPGAQAIEWGIAVHQGQQYGPINRYLMLAACLSILALAASSVLMWLKRRPRGCLGAPPAPENKGAALAALGIIAVIGVIYPLTGFSLVAALIVDWCVCRAVAFRRPA